MNTKAFAGLNGDHRAGVSEMDNPTDISPHTTHAPNTSTKGGSAIRTISPVVALLCALAFSGCNNPTYYETAPVDIETSKGVVTCQLYTPSVVVWDQAVLAPESMSIPEADSICKNEGLRRKEAS
ncbi:hypothetical protein [Ruegeria sp. EL01]|jgi:hypothetical protein|uniref:hypothetical protein n=1 Tax=Ruegeria sp. EL01 TaxID=2107578 RepID=UPI0020B145E5|nr:hypothetical protein [Ruegeria sp. EL01]